jgi:hypothetical protein
MAPEQVCDDFREISRYHRVHWQAITEDQLMENGWRVVDQPRNPYADRERLPLRRNDWH